MKTTVEVKPVLNFVETAKFLGVSAPTLSSYIRNKEIPFRKIRGRYFFLRTALIEWVKGEAVIPAQK